jgi:hypothetical protein
MKKLIDDNALRFSDLPFNERPDLTPDLIHLTKNTMNKDHFDNLVNILTTGELWGSDETGYIKGPNKATCFMDIPFFSLKYVLNKDNTNPERPRYEPYGVFVSKQIAYDQGCRPVLYLSQLDTQALKIPDEELWRVVRFEHSYYKGWKSWLHEREWRCKGNFTIPECLNGIRGVGVLVKNTVDVWKLQKIINEGKTKVKPNCIIPLDVICQGLNLM